MRRFLISTLFSNEKLGWSSTPQSHAHSVSLLCDRQPSYEEGAKVSLYCSAADLFILLLLDKSIANFEA